MTGRFVLAALLLLVGLSAPSAQLSMMGIGPAGAGGGALTPCTSTGIFNLNNVCNDIYFIGALK